MLGLKILTVQMGAVMKMSGVTKMASCSPSSGPPRAVIICRGIAPKGLPNLPMLVMPAIATAAQQQSLPSISVAVPIPIVSPRGRKWSSWMSALFRTPQGPSPYSLSDPCCSLLLTDNNTMYSPLYCHVNKNGAAKTLLLLHRG